MKLPYFVEIVVGITTNCIGALYTEISDG